MAQTLAALRASEARFRRLIENAAVGLVLGDSSGGLHYVNDALLRLLGYTRSEVDPELGGSPLRWDQLTPPEYLPLDANAIDQTRRGEQPAPYEKVYLTRDGRRIPVLVGLTHLETRADGVLEIAAFVLDLSARVAAEAALAFQTREQERLAYAERLARRRAEGLTELTAALARATAISDVARVVIEEAVHAVGATAGAMALLSADARTFTLISGPGITPDIVATWHVYPNEGPLPAVDAVRTRLPVYSPTRAAYTSRHPDLAAAAERLNIEAEATLPLLTAEGDEAPCGVVSFLFDTPRTFGEADDAFLRAIAGRCAEAVERIRIIDEERAARRALAERTSQLQAALKHPAVVLTTCDRSLRYTSVQNPHVAHRDASIVGRSFDEVLDLTDPGVQRLHALKARVVALGLPQRALITLPQGAAHRTYEVLAHPMFDDSGEVSGVSTVSIDVTEREQTAAALRLSQERYALAARATSNAIRDWDPHANRMVWNDGLHLVFDYPPGSTHDTTSWWEHAIHPEDRERVLRGLAAAFESTNRSDWSDEYRFRRGDGRWATVIDRGVMSRDGDGVVRRMIAALEDVTPQRELEARLRQAQKMEAVGQLAGGIAHDFNNLLTIIVGNLELLREDVTSASVPPPTTAEALGEISDAVQRARALVRQLLMFSRKQPVRPQLLDLCDIVRGTERMLRRLIGEEITLLTDFGAAPAPVLADPGQLEQVILNLVVNARDAMLTGKHGHSGRGGTLTIAVSTSADQQRGGPWSCLIVRDTGHGMDAATQAHIFEPFFTTKDVGGGTGLGLATVFGIVRQCRGTIHVDSTVGEGTTFTVCLPRAAARPVRDREPTELPVAAANAYITVLVVEDEEPVRTAVRRILERRGYRVLEARHGGEALALWPVHGPEIDAVISDVRMPEIGGPDLVARLREERPTLPVVLMSGYDAHATGIADGPYQRFVEKPFSVNSLLKALAEVTAVMV